MNPKKPIDMILKSYFKSPILKNEFENFTKHLQIYKDSINTDEGEEFNKTLIKNFLVETNFKNYTINIKGNIDLAIYADNNPEVLVETKKPNNKAEMTIKDDLYKKSFSQILLYFLEEKESNPFVKSLIITNFYEWFIFDVKNMETIANNKDIQKLYKSYKQGNLLQGHTKDFYGASIDIMKRDSLLEDIPFVHINIDDIKNDKEIISLYKLLSPISLLKADYENDANSLDKNFYNELLYILGLEEQKDGGKKLIKRVNPKDRQNGSILENIFAKLENYDKSTNEEQKFEIGMGLIVIWLNRILFLKLLEAKLILMHNEDFIKFLSPKYVEDFDILETLFFEVLAKEIDSRDSLTIEEFKDIPYLNSSLFELTQIEKTSLKISNLKDNLKLKIHKSTILKDSKDTKQNGDLSTLKYLLSFLDSYNFGSDNKEKLVDDHKPLISASVLGLIFEKLNGYKDGSFYTPSFITMYMAKKSLEDSILSKFNTHYDWECKSLIDIYNKSPDLKEANSLVNSITICDPAVGSGHFLVSCLNEILRIKSELGILCDSNGKLLKDYRLIIENDELYIIDSDENFFSYCKNSNGSFSPEVLRVQQTLFKEKKIIIENQLFGVDINPNSVNITRLRLWIELLKFSYYDERDHLITLPNIDINIKCGNSLISRFSLSDDIDIKNIKEEITNYKEIVQRYKNGDFLTTKEDIQISIDNLKAKFGLTLKASWSDTKKLDDTLKEYVLDFGFDGLDNELAVRAIGLGCRPQPSLFDDETITKQKDIKKQKLQKDIKNHNENIKEKESGEIYKDAFEWRFEFPEILGESGEFLGFDMIIGNPPYIKEYTNKSSFDGLRSSPYYQGKMDIWYFFTCFSIDLLKEYGILSFIAQNNWISSSGASNFRYKVLSESKIVEFIDFGNFMVFENASIQTMILNLQKTSNNLKYNTQYSKLLDDKFSKENIKYFLDKQNNDKFIAYSSQINKNDLINANITFLKNNIANILDKIENNRNFMLDNSKEVAQGIVTPNDAINKKSLEELGNTYKLNEGIFNLTTKEKDDLNFTNKELELIKPLYTTNEITHYTSSKNNKLWVIYTDSGFKNKEKIKPYPNLKKHLDRFQKIITTDNKPYGIHRARNEYFFKDEKILSLRKCVNKPLFSYVNFDSYVNQAFYVIKSKRINLKYLTAILNSKLISFWLRYKGKMQGDNYQVDKEPILNIPINKTDEQNQQPFIDIVDKIIKLKTQNEDTKELEDKIDDMVYKLYDLTKDEIKTIESN
jgi:adenine-specific DNA-methyltransferase